MTKKEIQYNAGLAVLAYQTPESIQWKDYKLNLIKWIEHKPSDTQGFVAVKNRSIYVVFRGSESKKDFQNDGSVSKVPFIRDGEKVHIGFKSCWEPVEEDVYTAIREAKDTVDTVDSVVVCGHSLGGAVATLMAYSIKDRFYGYHVECCTIGSPRVGNKIFKQNYDKCEIETIRVVHNNDLVTHTPYIGFLHVNHQLRLDSDGNVKKGENTIGYLWDYLKSLFSGETIKDHMGENYMKAINNWVNK